MYRWLVLLLAMVQGLAGCGPAPAAESTYQGRSLSEWRVLMRDADAATQAEANGAVGWP